MNTVIGAVIVFPAAIDVIAFQNYTNPLSLLLVWLGVSILMHSFPSTGDAESLNECVIKNKSVNIFAKILILPFIGLIYLGAFGSFIWLDFLYALGVGMLLPNLLIHLL